MSEKSSGGGLDVASVLGIVLVTLKLMKVGDVATWSWWAVTSPFWAPAAVMLALLLVAGCAWLVVTFVEWWSAA